MRVALAVPDAVIVKRNDRHQGTLGVELGGPRGAVRGTPIVRAGHGALDAALAADAVRREAQPTLALIRAACRAGSQRDDRPLTDALAHTGGAVVDGLSITCGVNRGPSTVVHVATTRTVAGSQGRGRSVRTWLPLAEQSWN